MVTSWKLLYGGHPQGHHLSHPNPWVLKTYLTFLYLCFFVKWLLTFGMIFKWCTMGPNNVTLFTLFWLTWHPSIIWCEGEGCPATALVLAVFDSHLLGILTGHWQVLWLRLTDIAFMRFWIGEGSLLPHGEVLMQEWGWPVLLKGRWWIDVFWGTCVIGQRLSQWVCLRVMLKVVTSSHLKFYKITCAMEGFWVWSNMLMSAGADICQAVRKWNDTRPHHSAM